MTILKMLTLNDIMPLSRCLVHTLIKIIPCKLLKNNSLIYLLCKKTSFFNKGKNPTDSFLKGFFHLLIRDCFVKRIPQGSVSGKFISLVLRVYQRLLWYLH
jgi:hypothetical protein